MRARNSANRITRAVDGLDPVVRHVRQVEDVLHEAQQDHAGGGADHVAAPAPEAHAADHRGGEHGEDDALAVALLAGHRGDPASLHQAAERGQHAAGDVDPDLDALDLDAGGAGGGGVAADRVDRAAGPVVAQEQADQHEDEGSDHEGDRHLAEVGCAEVPECPGQVEQGLCLDDAVLQAGQHDRHAEGDDEAVQPAFHYQQPVNEAHRGTNREQDQQSKERIELRAAAVGDDRQDQPGRDHRREAVRRLPARGPCRRS